MDHSRLVDKLLNEIASARAGIAANYSRLWQGDGARAANQAAGPQQPADAAEPEDRERHQ